MIKYMRYLFVFFCLLLTGCSQPVLHDSNGNTVRFSDYRGKWIVLNYWATWCKPCYREVPDINAFYRAHYNKDAVVFGVSYDHAPVDQLNQLAKKIGAEFPTLTTDPAKQLGVNHVPGLPATFIIGPDGKLKKMLLGEQTQQSIEEIMK